MIVTDLPTAWSSWLKEDIATSLRFPIAAYVMALTRVAFEEEAGRAITSEEMAESTGLHPVHIRRVLGPLREAGLVKSQPGPGGGWRLARSPEEITLRDIFCAAKSTPLLMLPETQEGCLVANCLPTVLTQCFENAEAAFEAELESVSIADLIASARIEADALGVS